ncbi:DUF4112 domain-containing protein [Roseobacter sp. YSTF-M11]|uniref:DUF4112 domain-containing protein n=2 Tax=Roseobacter insulae TaxID=2859783 RepID=A0A9X1JX26_9RHOB|nr:DUF4112 domain-containing protein [Roseobacter insulae]
MAANTRFDALFGTAPILGDECYLFFKAYNRNFALLRKDLSNTSPPSESTVQPSISTSHSPARSHDPTI